MIQLVNQHIDYKLILILLCSHGRERKRQRDCLFVFMNVRIPSSATSVHPLTRALPPTGPLRQPRCVGRVREGIYKAARSAAEDSSISLSLSVYTYIYMYTCICIYTVYIYMYILRTRMIPGPNLITGANLAPGANLIPATLSPGRNLCPACRIHKSIMDFEIHRISMDFEMIELTVTCVITNPRRQLL